MTIALSALRKQQVQIGWSQDGQGHGVINFSTVCGAFKPEAAATLLQYNGQLMHGAFAVDNSASGPQVVLRANVLSDTTNALDLMRVLTSLAWQADQMEEKLTGSDLF